MNVKSKMPFRCGGFRSAGRVVKGRVAWAGEKVRIIFGDICVGTVIIIMPTLKIEIDAILTLDVVSYLSPPPLLVQFDGKVVMKSTFPVDFGRAHLLVNNTITTVKL